MWHEQHIMSKGPGTIESTVELCSVKKVCCRSALCSKHHCDITHALYDVYNSKPGLYSVLVINVDE